MALSTETVARKYINVAADTGISVDIPTFEAGNVYVYYGKASLTAVQGTDYTVSLAEDFNTFTVTPKQALIDKINALIGVDATETNYITVRRTLDYETEATPAGVRYTPFTSKEFDRCAMRDQQLAEKLERALTFPASELAGDVNANVIDVNPGQVLRRSDDGLSIVGADFVAAGATVTTVFTSRSAANAIAASAMDDGTFVFLGREMYEVQSVATGTKSATNDLGVDGLVPAGASRPEHYGATGNGVTDDTNAVKAFFADLYNTIRSSGMAYLSGEYKITSTVTVEKLTSGRIVGSGNGRPYEFSNIKNTGAYFVWAGNTTDPMFVFNGVTNVEFQGITWIGSDSGDNSQTAACVRLDETSYGMPTGGFSLNNCGFYYAVNGVQAGTNFDDTNCADIHFGGITTMVCDNGLMVNTEQGLNYLFNFVNARCTNIFNLDRGGCLTANMVASSGSENVLKLGRGGNNVGMATLKAVRIEKLPRVTNHPPRIVYCPDSGGAYTSDFTVTVDDVNTEQRTYDTAGAEDYHFVVNNGAQVSVRSARVMPNFAQVGSASGSKNSKLILDAGLFNQSTPDLSDFINADTDSTVIVRDCMSLSGEEVTNEYESGVKSNPKTLATDAVWADVFEVEFPGTSSMGAVLTMSFAGMLQGSGVRTYLRTTALSRSGGVLSVEDLVAGARTPSAAGTYVEMQVEEGGKASETGISISGATQANPCSITATGHGLSTGDAIYIEGVVGMTELNGLSRAITVVDADTFTLNGTDATGFTAYTSGGTAKTAVFKVQARRNGGLSSANLRFGARLEKTPLNDGQIVIRRV